MEISDYGLTGSDDDDNLRVALTDDRVFNNLRMYFTEICSEPGNATYILSSVVARYIKKRSFMDLTFQFLKSMLP
jgi:hypothetical protein